MGFTINVMVRQQPSTGGAIFGEDMPNQRKEYYSLCSKSVEMERQVTILSRSAYLFSCDTLTSTYGLYQPTFSRLFKNK
jgi:hypothetical protein